MMKCTGKLVVGMGMGLVLLQSPVHSADIVKANNATNLDASGAWTGGVVPGSGDIAVFDSTLTAARTPNLGSSLSIGGIRVSNPTGTQVINNGTTGAVLTLGSSGIDMSAATANFSLLAQLDLTASQTWSIASGRTLTVGNTTAGANSTGAGTITVTGAGGILSLATSSIFTSGVLTSGVLGTGNFVLGNGLTLTASGSRTIGNAITLNGDITVSETGANSLSFRGGIDVGSATRTMTISTTGGTATAYSVFLGGNGTVASHITGAGGRIDFENGNVVASPVVSVRSDDGTGNYSAIDTDMTVGSNVVFIAARSNILNSDMDLTLNGTLNMSNNGGSINNESIGSLIGSGTVTNGSPTGTGSGILTIDGGTGTSVTNANFTGNIVSGVSGSIGVVKNGTTVQKFSGANDYRGKTVVNAGTLLINGTHIETTSFGTTGNDFAVAGGTFGGSGLIRSSSTGASAVMLQIGAAGILAPGDGIGTLTLDGINMTGATSKILTMALGAKLNFELAGDGSSADQLALWNYVSGDLALNSNAINFTLSGSQVSGTYTVDLLRFYSDSGLTLATNGITSGFTLGTLDSAISAANLIYNSAGGLVQLQYTVAAVPEPSTYALLGIGLVGLWFLRRKGRQA